MSSIPLKQIPLGGELLRLRMVRSVRDGRYLAARRSFEQGRDLLEVDPCRADVLLQSKVVTVAALWQQAPFEHHVRDDSVGSWIAFRRAVTVLDDVDANWLDEAVGTDLQNLVDASI